jgi:GDPmannose 4,6-dehydratase
MWLMLQQDVAEDYVIATGVQRSVREFVDAAFSHLALDPTPYVAHDPALVRPAEPGELVGDFSKARAKLGWEPRTSFEELVSLMVDHDLELLASGEAQKQSG